MTIPRPITTPLRRLSAETLAEGQAARERILLRELSEARQRAADLANDQRTEARTRLPRRTNIHE
jgi:hypothetical protein